MNATAFRNGLRVGITFTVIYIFLVLIGFTVTGAALVSKVFGNTVAQGALPDVSMFVILWACWVYGPARLPPNASIPIRT
jgi:hypothetical protein